VLGIARKLGVDRQWYGQALANAEPPERLKWERKRPIMAPLMPFIDAILEPDRNAPLNQRHIWQRIVTEHPERKVSEVTIRQYIRERKRELG
jgi:hypothetical protein